ncbi:WD40 repeat-like protein [Russula earlei]|uniref:WD40 repeat-like protein n=1 Tax=Russula earlei TaxID=71964 RepID=A0ACC0TTY7_9AGAM|nr:WD40 repeat-like protein [Russula earlei]
MFVSSCLSHDFQPDSVIGTTAPQLPTMSSSSFAPTSLGGLLPPYKSETSSDYSSQTESSTVLMPVIRPPTPAPSPRPTSPTASVISLASSIAPQLALVPFQAVLNQFLSFGPMTRQEYLAALLAQCSSRELFFISTRIAPLLKRDILTDLPIELSLHILSFVDHPRTLARIACVSRKWHALAQDEQAWRGVARAYHFDPTLHGPCEPDADDNDTTGAVHSPIPHVLASPRHVRPLRTIQPGQSAQALFKYAWSTLVNWKRGGRCLRAHRIPVLDPDSGVVTSVALDADWLVAGLANHRIHVFSTHTGSLVRTLVGHELGVWAVDLISRGGALDPAHPRPPPYDVSGTTTNGSGVPQVMEGPALLLHNRAPAGAQVLDPQGLDHLLPPSKRAALALDAQYPPTVRTSKQENGHDHDESARSDVACATRGWGQPGALVVSGGCDKDVRVWDVRTGLTLYVLRGHTSTVRCLKVIHNRPIAVSGSRDGTLRVWDVQRGRMLYILTGHAGSVRSLDVCGSRVVSGSYDGTCRLWDVDTGECLQVFRGHFNQIYAVAFDGKIVASGGLDTTVRVWDAHTGHCTAMLHGHTALVCSLQLTSHTLVTGGADGRVLAFALPDLRVHTRIAAHDSSVTSLQFDEQFLVTGGNDGRVRLFDVGSGAYIRDVTAPSETVWKVVFRREVCAIMCRRAGKTTVEIWSFRPLEERGQRLRIAGS